MDILSSEDILIPSGDSGRRRRPENRGILGNKSKRICFMHFVSYYHASRFLKYKTTICGYQQKMKNFYYARLWSIQLYLC